MPPPTCPPPLPDPEPIVIDVKRPKQPDDFVRVDVEAEAEKPCPIQPDQMIKIDVE